MDGCGLVHSLAQFLKTCRQVSLAILDKTDEENVHRVSRISSRSVGVGTNESTASDARHGHSCGSHDDCRRVQHPTWPPHHTSVTLGCSNKFMPSEPRVDRSLVSACRAERGTFIIDPDAMFGMPNSDSQEGAACWGRNAQKDPEEPRDRKSMFDRVSGL